MRGARGPPRVRLQQRVPPAGAPRVPLPHAGGHAATRPHGYDAGRLRRQEQRPPSPAPRRPGGALDEQLQFGVPENAVAEDLYEPCAPLRALILVVLFLRLRLLLLLLLRLSLR